MNRTKFLKTLKAYGLQNDIPNISQENAQHIRTLLKNTQAKKILEIGSANGYSTIHFADEIESWGWKITSIEFSQVAYEDAGKNFEAAEVSHLIQHYFWDAREILPLLEETYDFVFIDGLKKASLEFLRLVWNKTEKWWTIVIDDVIKFRYKMEDLYEYVEEEKLNYQIIQIDSDDGIMKIIR